MLWVRFAVVLLIATLLQASVLDAIAVSRFAVKPDMLLILLVFFAIYCDLSDSIVTSFLIGLAADIIATGAPLGVRMISYGIVGSALGRMNQLFAIRRFVFQAVAVFVASLAAGSLVYLVILTGRYGMPPNAYNVLLGSSLYSALIGPVLFLPIALLMGIKTQRFGRRKR